MCQSNQIQSNPTHPKKNMKKWDKLYIFMFFYYSKYSWKYISSYHHIICIYCIYLQTSKIFQPTKWWWKIPRSQLQEGKSLDPTFRPRPRPRPREPPVLQRSRDPTARLVGHPESITIKTGGGMLYKYDTCPRWFGWVEFQPIWEKYAKVKLGKSSSPK